MKDIFRATHYEDDALVLVIERRIGLDLETIEARVGEWVGQRIVQSAGDGSGRAGTKS